MSEEESAPSPPSPANPNPIAEQPSKVANAPADVPAVPQVAFYESTTFRLRVTPTPPGRVLFEIECSPKHADKLLQDAIATVQHHVMVPGFRKGKAPKEHILKSCYPAVEKTWKRMLSDEGLNFAVTQSGYTPLVEWNLLQVDVELGKTGSPPFMRCLCDAMSPVPHIDLEALRAHLKPIPATTVTQEDKDEALMGLARFHSKESTLHPIDDDLAKKAGCHNVAQLLERIEASLAQHAVRSTIMERLFDLKAMLIDHYLFDISPALIRLQIEMRRPIIDAAHLPKDQSEKIHSLEPFRAYEFLHSALLLQTWLRDQNVKLTEKDLEEEYLTQQQIPDPLGRMIHSEMEPLVLRQQLTWLATIHKGMMHLLKQLYPDTVDQEI